MAARDRRYQVFVSTAGGSLENEGQIFVHIVRKMDIYKDSQRAYLEVKYEYKLLNDHHVIMLNLIYYVILFPRYREQTMITCECFYCGC